MAETNDDLVSRLPAMSDAAVDQLVRTNASKATPKMAERYRMALLTKMVRLAERQRCAAIVHNKQITHASDACGFALDEITGQA